MGLVKGNSCGIGPGLCGQQLWDWSRALCAVTVGLVQGSVCSNCGIGPGLYVQQPWGCSVLRTIGSSTK